MDNGLQSASIPAMSNEHSRPSFSELMAQVGFLLMQWGFLEYAMRQINQPVADMGQIPELQEVRRIRNLVAHGICGARAHPSDPKEPFVSCLAQDGTILEISYSVLEDAVATLERYRLQNFRPPPSR